MDARRSDRVAGVAGVVAHVATGFFYVGSPLVAPLGGVLVLWAGWLVMLVVALWLRRARPWLALLVPVMSIAFWVAVISLGELLFGWTA